MTLFHIKTLDGNSMEFEHEATDVEDFIRRLISSQFVVGRSMKTLNGNQVGQPQRVGLMLSHVAMVQTQETAAVRRAV